MELQQFWDEVGSLTALRSGAENAAITTTLAFFGSVRASGEAPAHDWPRELLAASLVSADAPERLQDDALRIAQGCLQDPQASPDAKRAASYLLQRLGNGRAARLAQDKGLSGPDLPGVFDPLSLDVIRKKLELSVGAQGERVPVNQFQRTFWQAASSQRWVSVSAPTSAGKSYIVRLWLQSRMTERTQFKAVYVVPTRALIEEVSRELEAALGATATVTTMPWDARIGQRPREVFVLTQERLHILMRRLPELELDLIFVDEAQKLRDDLRGVLLQRALDEAVTRGTPQVMLASPLTSNPEVLLPSKSHGSSAIISETVTVNQTLLHVNQRYRKPLLWDMTILQDGVPVMLGEFDLPARPVPESKRLSLVAVALGRDHSGNVVYANGAADAEKIAGQIFDALGPSRTWQNAAVEKVVELIEKTIHPQYLLAKYLRRGVAFHYGNMPLLVREAVERLFRDGDVTYLVCTSTLLEGVNLPCQNLFVRAPRKGNSNPMSAPDFWNLAGRAGRWGVEFQGNVICLDTDLDAWQQVPVKRSRQQITRATDDIANDWEALVEYIEADTPVEATRANPLLESLFGLLASTRRRGYSIAEMSWLPVTVAQGALLDSVVDEALNEIRVPLTVLQDHAGISAFALQRLFDRFQEIGDREALLLPPPEDRHAVDSYIDAIAMCEEVLGADFTQTPTRHYSLALLFVQWMRGLPVAGLINGRIGWLRNNKKPYKLPTEIRNVLKEVEKYARFEGPRYLACYSDVLDAALPPGPDASRSLDIAMMMELGVSRQTEVSMMSLGLSRTTVVALAELIVGDNLTPEECLEWLEEQDFEALEIPALVEAEVRSAVAKRRGHD